ncbi:MAG: hypothetical protein LBP53_05210 [Candidatus Peribacteria bacterium]|jgi:hypothetical protein|nr:hypothetical protein [Candidatus Peribacteria bacterium]
MSNPKNIKSNDTRWKNVRNRLQDNGIKMLTAIGLAVAAIVVTVGTFGAGSGAGGLLMMGAVGTAGGIVGSRVGQFVNETLWNATIYRDTQYKYDDPIDIELLANGKIEPAEFIKNVGTEFLI